MTIRTERVNKLLATSLSEHDVERLLTPLGIEVHDGTAIVPTWRPDVEREIDLVEEVARRIGLDTIERTVPSNPAKIGSLTTEQRERRAVGDVLIGAGYDEVYTLPLIAAADLARAGAPTDAVIEVANPLRAEESVLRPALLPGLLPRLRTTPRTAIPTSRSSSSATCSRRLPPARPFPSSSCTSPLRVRGGSCRRRTRPIVPSRPTT